MAFAADTGAVGYSNDYDSRAGAEERALNECGKGCKVALWVKGGCDALATGDGNSYGTVDRSKPSFHGDDIVTYEILSDKGERASTIVNVKVR
ncbi:MAG TPA: DUF4189 domain-containing protein [Pseudolabrys sp.]